MLRRMRASRHGHARRGETINSLLNMILPMDCLSTAVGNWHGNYTGHKSRTKWRKLLWGESCIYRSWPWQPYRRLPLYAIVQRFDTPHLQNFCQVVGANVPPENQSWITVVIANSLVVAIANSVFNSFVAPPVAQRLAYLRSSTVAQLNCFPTRRDRKAHK